MNKGLKIVMNKGLKIVMNKGLMEMIHIADELIKKY